MAHVSKQVKSLLLFAIILRLKLLFFDVEQLLGLSCLLSLPDLELGVSENSEVVAPC